MVTSAEQMTLTHSHVQRSSILYTMIPTVVRNRIAPLRKSISAYSLGSRRQEETSLVMHRRSESQEVHVVTDKSGNVDIRQKHARHGWELLQTSLAESQYHDPQSQAFSRQLYIDSLSHLLQGLPSDITDQELIHLRNALPPSLEEPNQCKAIEASKPETSSCSILHRSISSSIILLCLLLRITQPYVKYFLALAHNYERTHHVTEKALTLSMNAADTLGKRSIEIAGTMLENKFVMGTVQYCVEGICGGLTEGLGEGMRAIEARKEP